MSNMATYLYETIPMNGEKSETFEFSQSMKDAPLTTHPESGKPIRRVITGGFGFLKKGGTSLSTSAQDPTGGGCGSGCGCH